MSSRRLSPSVVAFGLLIAAVALASAQRTEAGSWLSDVAARYRAWGRVDDELRWAPWLCRMPLASRARPSQAEGAEHARKVYFVYASDRSAYIELVGDRRRAPRRGFTVVKEAFHPRAVETPAEPFGQLPLPPPLLAQIEAPPSYVGGGAEVYRPTVDAEGHATGAGEPGGLYVLRYVGAGARGTDHGWTYGTIDARGEVTAEGRIASCIGCHESAPHGRLFGFGQTRPDYD
ncbi:MAG: hypothetical protein AB7S26_38980 [Sandaracinaceae bacterium]